MSVLFTATKLIQSTFKLEEGNSRGCYDTFEALWMRGQHLKMSTMLKCVCSPVTCRTINRAKLPLMSTGEDFFIEGFSLLELALFEVTGCLKKKREIKIVSFQEMYQWNVSVWHCRRGWSLWGYTYTVFIKILYVSVPQVRLKFPSRHV